MIVRTVIWLYSAKIIEIQENAGGVPGEFTVWALTDRAQLQTLSLTVPRTLLINAKHGSKVARTLADELNGVIVKRDLPHAHACLDLFEVNIPEKKFVRNERALNMFLCDPHVRNIVCNYVALIPATMLHDG